MKLAEFATGFEVILFDMDGVITSEQRYWDAAALACYELLSSRQYYGEQEVDAVETMRQLTELRRQVFCEEETIRLLKNLGVNSNWDITYVVAGLALLLHTKDYRAVYEEIKRLSLHALELYQYIEEQLGQPRGGELWTKGVSSFQEWYLGDKEYQVIYQKIPVLSGKPGLMSGEVPIIPVERLHQVLSSLKDAGISLGVGTGRVDYEIKRPLEDWGIKKYFDSKRIITYTDIEKAEEQLPGETLTKPHPYMFLKGYCGKEYADEKIVRGEYDRAKLSKTLVVGDAGADIYAARAAGMKFCAVLTGASGEDARPYFEKEKADFILHHVGDFLEG